ncbi:S-adenosyl-L-methionine-dependent methyltransferase [Gongronella butleri]|nr:S-adenosyl-L-methionine-dependent methyltransferase [Gongronella butleri]
MTDNKYDDPLFFNEYKKMARSQSGLQGAGEWPALQKMMPSFEGKSVLDIGCGYGWHALYAVQHGATRVLGLDNSQKMLDMAEEKKNTIEHGDRITYQALAMEQLSEVHGTFDIVISSLALHYVESFDNVVAQVHRLLAPGGHFVFSVEHPVFTASGTQQWHLDADGRPQFWPVDHYYEEGKRTASFLGCNVTKYHKTVTTYVQGLIKHGKFQLLQLVEPCPEPELLKVMPDEIRRPMMLLIAAQKK